MFGMGGSEILVILIVALLFLGPEKLPGAARQISKGIRDIKKQSRSLQATIENDETIGGAIRDLKSALRGEDIPVKPKPRPAVTAAAATVAAVGAAPATPALPEPGEPVDADAAMGNLAAAFAALPPSPPATATDDDAPHTTDTANAPPAVTLPPIAGEPHPDAPVTDDAEDLASLVRPADGAIARGSERSNG